MGIIKKQFCHLREIDADIPSILPRSIVMKTSLKMLAAAVLLCMTGLAWTGCKPKSNTADNSLLDDGGGRKPADFPELALDVFQPMDGGIALSSDEIKGRNTWNLWCGGNEQF